MSSLAAEMELVKSFIKIPHEERKKEARRKMYEELRALEMERRHRVALEASEKLKREREEREKVEESLKRQREDEEERKAAEEEALLKAKQDQLKRERLLWKDVMMVEEEPGKRPRYTISALKEEQQRRQEEAELRQLPQVGDPASRDPLTSEHKATQQQGRRKTLYNNWVGEGKKTDSAPVKEKPHPNDSTYLLFAAKQGLKSEDKPKAPKPSVPRQWLDKLKVGSLVEKYRSHRERLDQKRQLKAEEQHARFSAYKESRAHLFARQHDCYMGGFAQKRNSILGSMF
ncbi:reticulocyte-binding protein 2 homolog a-like [Notolabrus celidotus]|uniref:reticulocyte-binding protein 2 homolog a-like n=1 Tax=Notolabrus celidotus TaxID=1203425 RepID=UPI00148F86D2|nr:reticulocyte-binding protein 2 homolog a-like [Notolabrus celidotus]